MATAATYALTAPSPQALAEQNRSHMKNVFELKGLAYEGIDIIREALEESELGGAESVQDLGEGTRFFSLEFTYGPLHGQVSAYRYDLCRPHYEIEIDGHETYKDMLYAVKRSRFPDEDAKPLLIKEFFEFLDSTLENHVPPKSAVKKRVVEN